MTTTPGYPPVNKGLRRSVIPVIILFFIFLCIIPSAGAGSTVTDGNSISGLTASSEEIQFQRARDAATVLNDRWGGNMGGHECLHVGPGEHDRIPPQLPVCRKFAFIRVESPPHNKNSERPRKATGDGYVSGLTLHPVTMMTGYGGPCSGSGTTR